MKTCLHTLALILGLLVLCASAPAAAQEDRQNIQAQVESGSDLSPRAQTILFRARAKQDAGEWTPAAQVMTDWLTDHPERDHHLLSFNLAVSLLNLDRTAEARAALDKAVALEPRFARGWLRLGEAAYELQDFATAAEAFATSFNLTPNPPADLLYYSGVAWLSAGESGKAVDTLAGLLETRPEADLSWYQALLAAAVEAKQTQRAAPLLANLLEVRPDNPEAWELAYRFAAADEDYRQAAVYLTVMGYLRPLTDAELKQLGDLYAVINVPLQAARYYEQALGSETGSEDELSRLAASWLAAHELDKGRQVLMSALTNAPTAELWFLLGDLEYMAEDFAAAADAFEQGCGLDADHGRGWLMLGYCRMEAGDKAAARKHLRRAAEFPEQESSAKSLLKTLP